MPIGRRTLSSRELSGDRPRIRGGGHPVGHYGPYPDQTSDYGQQGQSETLIFADATFTGASGLSAATAASTEARSGKQAKLAEAADGLAEEARKLPAKAPEPGRLGADGDKPTKHHADTGKQQHDTNAKQANQDKQVKQPKREKTQNTHQRHRNRGWAHRSTRQESPQWSPSASIP